MSTPHSPSRAPPQPPRAVAPWCSRPCSCSVRPPGAPRTGRRRTPLPRRRASSSASAGASPPTARPAVRDSRPGGHRLVGGQQLGEQQRGGARERDPAVAAPGPSGLPVPAAPGPSLTGPLPATGNANGAVVKGFPTTVVPIPEGLTVVSSSVSASGDRLQVGLQASSDSAPADVQAAYVAALSAAGFAVGDSPALPGTTATSFTRGPDGLVLTVTARTGGGTELSVAGTLTTAG